jgi:glycosyltransferase involved in cell wall biosynthesis
MLRAKLIKTSTVPESLYGLLKGQLKYLSQHFEVVGISSKGNFLDETSKREGIRTIEVEMQRGISPFKDLISLFRLYHRFKIERPTIVHSITPKAGLLSMLAAKFAGVPIRMHTFTGLIFPTKKGFMQNLLIWMDRLLCWAATNIYPEGNGVKNDLINFKITSRPLKVIANGNVNGIDLDFFSISQVSEKQKNELKNDLRINSDDFIFIFVGRLVGDKGINELVTAFTELNMSNSKLLLVGPLEEHLDPLNLETIEQINSNPSILNVGFQKDVRPYFAISDALVFPSYREGFPNVVIQAGAMELPSIVSDINGCNEIIIEDENGTIIPVNNTDAIKTAMNKMMLDIEYFSRLKNNTRKMIQSRYEQAVVWNALLEEYNYLTDQNIKSE